MKNILITGGLGYIGSITAASLLEQNENIVIIDNLSNSDISVLERLKLYQNGNNLSFYNIDLNNHVKLNNIFKEHTINLVIHFAGFKYVPESMLIPSSYYFNNVSGSCSLLKCCIENGVRHFIFSSTASLYSDIENKPPYDESAKISYNNPYTHTKLIFEQILESSCKHNDDFSAVSLRYFNPVGCDSSGYIGENITNKSTNLMAKLIMTLKKPKNQFIIFGNDYDTKDGTALRDFIHVQDLVKGHILALNYISNNSGYSCFNIGTGRSTSVLSFVYEFEKLSETKISYTISERRSGDVGISFADVSKARKYLNFRAKKNITEMINDSLRYARNSKYI